MTWAPARRQVCRARHLRTGRTQRSRGRGAELKPTNQPFLCNCLRCFRVLRSEPATRSGPMPVLPAKSIPGIGAEGAVPSGSSTRAIASVMSVYHCWVDRYGLHFGVALHGHYVGRATRWDSPRAGRTIIPSMEMAAMARINWIGVVATAPCPMPTEMVSPANHFCLKLRIFHSSDGITPVTSFGRSMPVFCPRPSAVAYFAIRSMPSFSAKCVEEHVAGLVNRFVLINRAVSGPHHPATKAPSVKGRAAIAIDVERLRDPFLHPAIDIRILKVDPGASCA